MTQKKSAPRRPFETFAEQLADSIQRKRGYALCWKACAVNPASPNCAVKRVSTRTCITVGRRSFWRPVRNVWPAIPHGKRTPMKSKGYAARPRS
jgi:hypothetical protein